MLFFSNGKQKATNFHAPKAHSNAAVVVSIVSDIPLMVPPRSEKYPVPDFPIVFANHFGEDHDQHTKLFVPSWCVHSSRSITQTASMTGRRCSFGEASKPPHRTESKNRANSAPAAPEGAPSLSSPYFPNNRCLETPGSGAC